MKRIVCQNLAYRIAKTELLEEINAEFQSGQINVILGQNGAGKSTLLSLVAKSLEPTEGEIFWHKEALSSISLQALALQRAVVEQQQGVQFDFTVRQLVSLGLEIQYSSELLEAYRHEGRFERCLQRIITICDLDNLLDRSILSLSGGEFKRAQLARALAQIWPLGDCEKRGEEMDFSGRWLLMDEWNAALDMRHQQCFAAMLRQWCRQGLGVIMVVHDLPLAMQLADRVLLLKQGQVVAEGEAKEVLQPLILQEALEMQLQSFHDESGQALYLPQF
ncbi:ATP-binding cassette domain-containing protein [Thiomicrorhabdus xiamenensis]|uniref:ATP-binding cassette domain-containing protein n=1 Tax=Thiomicrorhabdus xiamenensis TaxID=2739063 RepID=A0A7D4P5R0_9GAMM|nr:ATP-binding cassette domain-containing protein [Thiomicrorhabdus xiamenensis]QKI89875.1 ATP-binding cassette domain-containing protein [Thiomicrorhabdus xiamenensis]